MATLAIRYLKKNLNTRMKNISLLSVALLVVGAVSFGALLLRGFVFTDADTEFFKFLSPPKEISMDSFPPPSMQLKIPSLDIEADVEYVGINSKGNMASPTKYADVAWYEHGTVPGDRGSAVMAGHVDNGLGLTGVFKTLPSLKVGDDVYVEREGAEPLHFKVEEIKTYPYKSVPVDDLFNRESDAWLNLVTCVGKWVASDKTYDQRLIVYTRLVNNSANRDTDTVISLESLSR